MNFRSFILRVAGSAAFFALASVVFTGAAGTSTAWSKAADVLPSAGRILIYSAQDGNKSQLPPARFDHDKHTLAVSGLGGNCTTCHLPPAQPSLSSTEEGQGGTAYAFKNTDGLRGEDLKNTFHKGCISCHAAQKKAGNKSGPQTAQCRSCHIADPLTAPKFTPSLDKYLHYRHVSSPEIIAPGESPNAVPNTSPSAVTSANCTACHHPVPSMPERPRIDSCRSCHGSSEQDKRPAFHRVAHQSCISCHVEKLSAKKSSGPVTCAGCHDAKTWAGYARLTSVPLLQLNQPVVRLMEPPPQPAHQPAVPQTSMFQLNEGQTVQQATPDEVSQASMTAVVFNHGLHEKTLPSCRSCHHKTLQACSTCHTLTGDAKGKGVNLSQAMHAVQASQSCVGCHRQRSANMRECSACHSKQPVYVETRCVFCHKAPDAAPSDAQIQPRIDPASGKAEAKLFVPGPYETGPPPPYRNAPEIVRIGGLSHEFAPSEFPHRRIITAIANKIEKAAPSLEGMHTRGYALCMGCHHNSPPSATPPKCVSCHPKAMPDARQFPADGRPLLKAAYHLQCMNCHDRMQITKPANTACVECHAKRDPAP